MLNSMILRDHSSSSITKAMEANIAFVRQALWANYRGMPDVEVVIDDTIARIYTGLPGPMFNGVLYARFDPHELEPRVDTIIDYFQQRKVPFSWWVGPTSRPDTLEEVLSSRGMIQAPFDTPGMAIDLRALNKQLFEKAIQRSNTVVQRVQTKTELKEWVGVTGKIFGLLPKTVEAFYEMHAPHIGRRAKGDVVDYIAFIEGEPVGVSYLAYSAGVVGLYSVGTLSDYRGKGIGTAVSLAPLLEAKQQGYEIGTLQSTQLAVNVYTRMGFKTHCQFKTYFALPE